jgi:Carboxypeptidase regulatory-like domain/TonB dependent receptor
MVRRLRRLIAVAAVLCIIARAAVAAGPRLELKGRVVDENGLPVGEAQVKLEQAGGQFYLATSDDSGYFLLTNVAPGECTVRIEKPGFFLLANQKVELKAESGEFTFTLNHAEEVHEQVDVTVPENRIDPASTSSTESLSGQEIIDIPVPSSHDLAQSLVAMPLVVLDNSDLLHIAGARNTNVQYLLDGVEVGDPASNGLTSRMIVEAVRKAEIQTSRFGAEYAHPGGAILEYRTREGDDRWRFNATDFIPGINVQDGVQLGNFYPRVTFSGPIVPESLWFSESLDLLHTLSVQKGLPPGAPNQTQLWGGDTWSRLLWKQTTNNSLHLGFLANVNSDVNAGLDALHPQSVTTDIGTRELFGFVKEQSYFEKTVAEVGVGVEDSLNEMAPQGTAPYVLLVSGSEGNYYQRQNEDARRYQLFASAIRGPLKWFGTHTISMGANFSGVELTQDSTRGEIQALRADLTLDRLTTFAGNANFQVTNTMAGGFVEDSWSPNAHFVFMAGVRADWDRLFQSALLQPRLAGNWMPWKNNRAKFSVGWGLYDIPLNLSMIGQAYDQQQVDALYDPTGKIVVSGPATSTFVFPAAGLQSLQQPYFQIASAGWQQRIGENTLVSVELLARDEHHGLVWETVTPGQIGSEFLLQSSRRDKYRGATITARHTFKNTAELFGSYTRSQSSTDQVLDPMLGTLYFAPQQPGPLSWDAPNRVLAWGSIPTPIWGILFSFLEDFHSGFPYSAINQQQFLVGAANSLRFPDYASLTIALEKKFTFRDRVFAVRVAAINILDRENPTVVVNNVDAPNYGMFTGGQGRAFTARLRFVGRK